MSEKVSLELTRRRALGALLTVGAGSAAAGAGTFALFSDTESSTGNSVTAGTLNLDLTEGSDTTSLNVTDAAPGDAGYVVLELTNNGSLAGDIDVLIENVSGSDGTDSEFESSPTADGSELLSTLDLSAWLDATGMTVGSFSGEYGASNGGTQIISPTKLDSVSEAELSGSSVDDLAADSSMYAVVEVSIPSGAGNAIQGDSANFDITFELNQQESQ